MSAPGAFAPVTFAGALLVAATPRRPVLDGGMSGRLFPDQMDLARKSGELIP